MTVDLLTAPQTTTPTTSYLDAFLTERPKDGVDLVQNRLRKGLKLNEELAEYFKERANAEDAYAKTLIKISKKYYVSDKSALGNMLPLWEMLHKELTEIYTIHAVMSLKIIEDIEQPLRASIQCNPEYNAIKSMDANLQRISKDYDDRLARLNKHKSKGRKTGESEAKVAEATKSLEESRAQWLQAGPEYIQKHQAVDEHRLNTLRTSIQNFEVLQNDQLLKRVEVANNVLTAASTFDVTEEISSFASSHAPAAPALPMHHSVSQSGRSILSIESSPGEALSVPSHINAGPMPVPSISEQSYSSTGAQSTGGKSTGGKSASRKKTGKDRKFLSGLVSIRRKAKSGGGNGYMNADLVPPVMEHSDQYSTASLGMAENSSSFSNGFASEREEPRSDDIHSPAPTSPSSLSSPPSIQGAPSIAGSVGPTSQPKVLVDEEGYTIPPADRTAWPAEAGTAAGLLDDDFNSDSGSLFGNQRLKVDIKTEAVKDEDAVQSRVALTRVTSMLKERSTAPTGKRRGRRENRMTRLLDPVVENKLPTTLTNESVQEEPSVQEGISSTPAVVLVDGSAEQQQQQPAIPVIMMDAPAEGAASLSVSDEDPTLRAPSINDSVFGDHLHSPFDDLSAPAGLQDIPVPVPAPISTPQIKVSITETIHSLLKGGEVVQSAVIGDVNITYNGPADITGPVFFRLDGIEALERVAPNSSYLAPVDGEPGVFRLDTNMYYFAGDSPVPSLKYQVKLDETHKELPIWAKPMWKCEEDQTRLLVKYRKTGHLRDIHGVFFMTTVSGNVQNMQSIPAGQWMVDQERMVWPMGEWQDDQEHMLRAKFTTKHQGTPQPLAIRFEGKDWLVSDVSIVNNDQATTLLQREDGGVWADVQVVEKSVRTGKYIAEA